MNFAKLDDRYDDHRKIKRAWRQNRALVGLHAMAITYCWRHNTDGIVDIEWLEEKLPRAAEREKLVGLLVELGLFDHVDEHTWRVHDYLDFQDSSEKRAARVSAGRKAAQTRWGAKGMPAASDPQCDPHAEPNTEERRGEERRTAKRPSDAAAASGAPAATVETIWTTYLTARHRVLGPRSTPHLTAARRALIARRLKEWPAADLLAAVQGWEHFAHNRGENDQGQPYCDVELLLRDAAHIERFRDKHTQSSKPGESMASLADRMTAAHAATEAAA